MELVLAIVMVFLASLVAQVMTPGLRPFGVVVTTAIGVIGFIIATLIGHWLELYESTQYAGFVATLLAVLIMLTLYRLAGPRHAGHPRRSVGGYRAISARQPG